MRILHVNYLHRMRFTERMSPKMKTIIHHDDSIMQVKVPLPFPLRWINSYVIKGNHGYTVIDPGIHTAEAEQVWDEVMQEIGAGYTDIEQIVLTHHHPDHYGMSGWIRERSGAAIYMSKSAWKQAKLLWGNGQPLSSAILALFRHHGMDEHTLSGMLIHLQSFVAQVSPQPVREDIRFLQSGEVHPLGNRKYELLDTPGHAHGHLSFFDRGSGVIFCGDQVLPQITPNVSLIPGIDPDPLKSYLESLDMLRTLPAEQAYPGHRNPFQAFNPRVEEIMAHHQERLQAMVSMIESEASMHAFRLCRKLFGERLSLHQLRFALSETIAHLIYLENQEKLVGTLAEGVVYYSVK